MEFLNAFLSYDPLTGVLTWKWSRGGWAKRGAIAGSLDKSNGYVKVGLTEDGYKGQYRAHRIAWAIMTGAWPTEDIDHKNTDRSDNRWENLRLARDDQNKANGRAYKTSKHKKGAHLQPSGRWASAIRVMNKTIHLGTFDTEDEAHERYCAEAARVRGEFARFE